MATCTIEIWTNMQWKECCTVEIDQPSTGGFGSSMLDYEHNYVFEQSPRDDLIADVETAYRSRPFNSLVSGGRYKPTSPKAH